MSHPVIRRVLTRSAAMLLLVGGATAATGCGGGGAMPPPPQPQHATAEALATSYVNYLTQLRAWDLDRQLASSQRSLAEMAHAKQYYHRAEAGTRERRELAERKIAAIQGNRAALLAVKVTVGGADEDEEPVEVSDDAADAPEPVHVSVRLMLETGGVREGADADDDGEWAWRFHAKQRYHFMVECVIISGQWKIYGVTYPLPDDGDVDFDRIGGEFVMGMQTHLPDDAILDLNTPSTTGAPDHSSPAAIALSYAQWQRNLEAAKWQSKSDNAAQLAAWLEQWASFWADPQLSLLSAEALRAFPAAFNEHRADLAGARLFAVDKIEKAVGAETVREVVVGTIVRSLTWDGSRLRWELREDYSGGVKHRYVETEGGYWLDPVNPEEDEEDAGDEG